MEKEFVQKAALFVSANIFRPRKQKISFVCLFDSLRPVNTFPVMSGWVFHG